MKIKKESLDKKIKRLEQWHRWFAWFPIRINDNELVWLEMIERKGIYQSTPYEAGYFHFLYRLKT